jgi:exodeoxyribonuclease V alpha subunit
MAYFSGRVHSISFRGDNDFFILKMQLDESNHKIVSVLGDVPGIGVQIGTWFGFEAEWGEHPKFGMQLKILKAPIFKSGFDLETVRGLLAGEGVPSTVIKALEQAFGETLPQVISDPSRLTTVSGISLALATDIAEKWQAAVTYIHTLNHLSDLGIPAGKIKKIWAMFGDKSEEVLSTNPWSLVKVSGITFATADAVASKLGLRQDLDPRRVGACIVYCLREMRQAGHLFALSGELKHEVTQLIKECTTDAFAAAAKSLVADKGLILDKVTKPGVLALYDPYLYFLEDESAAKLAERQTTALGESQLERLRQYVSDGQGSHMDLDPKALAAKALEIWGSQAKMVLSEDQKRGALNALTEPVSILTGLPGTGKTTSLKAAVQILSDAGVDVLLVAPTGIAAKRLQSTTGHTASTIHRAFMGRPGSSNERAATYAGVQATSEDDDEDLVDDSSFWEYTEDNPHPADIVFIDESSMLDQRLIYRILVSTSKQCRIVFVGDYAQLPSVGPGNVLRDLIRSGIFPCVKLSEIFRQKDTSAIVTAAHAIVKGQVPPISGDFVFIDKMTDEEVFLEVVDQAVALYDQRVTRSFQVLSPRHMSVIGVSNLNETLRERINPGAGDRVEFKIGSAVVREKDRVMIVKNDYNRRVFNGDTGKVDTIDKAAGTVQIMVWDDPPRLVEFEIKECGKMLRLAYACTIHKSQGLEYDYIILPLTMSLGHQLQRNLLYTAITRAKEKVILVGSRSALKKAVLNDREASRNTMFAERLIRNHGS